MTSLRLSMMEQILERHDEALAVTLRDRMAMAALQGQMHANAMAGYRNDNDYQRDELSKAAYQYADAMLRAREAK